MLDFKKVVLNWPVLTVDRSLAEGLWVRQSSTVLVRGSSVIDQGIFRRRFLFSENSFLSIHVCLSQLNQGSLLNSLLDGHVGGIWLVCWRRSSLRGLLFFAIGSKVFFWWFLVLPWFLLMDLPQSCAFSRLVDVFKESYYFYKN